jgi:hypothetical protein
MTAGLPKFLNSLRERLPEGFFVFRFFQSICGLVVKKYLEGGDKKEANILGLVFVKFKLFYRGGKK